MPETGDKGKEKGKEKETRQETNKGNTAKAQNHSIEFCDLYIDICDLLKKRVARTDNVSKTTVESGYDDNVYPILVNTSEEAYKKRHSSSESMKSLPEKIKEKAQGIIIDAFQERMSRRSIMPNEKNLSLLNNLCQYIEEHYTPAQKEIAMPALTDIFHAMYNIYHQHDCADTALNKLAAAIDQFIEPKGSLIRISNAISELQAISLSPWEEQYAIIDTHIKALGFTKEQIREENKNKLPSELNGIFNSLPTHTRKYLERFEENKALDALSFENWLTHCEAAGYASDLKYTPLDLSMFSIDEELGLTALKHLLDLLFSLRLCSTKTNGESLYINKNDLADIESQLSKNIDPLSKKLSGFRVKIPKKTKKHKKKHLEKIPEKAFESQENRPILFSYMIYCRSQSQISHLETVEENIKSVRLTNAQAYHEICSTMVAFDCYIQTIDSHLKAGDSTINTLDIALYLYIFLLIITAHKKGNRKNMHQDIVASITFCKIIFDKMISEDISMDALFPTPEQSVQHSPNFSSHSTLPVASSNSPGSPSDKRSSLFTNPTSRATLTLPTSVSLHDFPRTTEETRLEPNHSYPPNSARGDNAHTPFWRRKFTSSPTALPLAVSQGKTAAENRMTIQKTSSSSSSSPPSSSASSSSPPLAKSPTQ